MLRLNEEDLGTGNLLLYQNKLFEDFSDDYNGTIIILKSDCDKEFGFFIANKF